MRENRPSGSEEAKVLDAPSLSALPSARTSAAVCKGASASTCVCRKKLPGCTLALSLLTIEGRLSPLLQPISKSYVYFVNHSAHAVRAILPAGARPPAVLSRLASCPFKLPVELTAMADSKLTLHRPQFLYSFEPFSKSFTVEGTGSTSSWSLPIPGGTAACGDRPSRC
jgi:hypothetical protein